MLSTEISISVNCAEMGHLDERARKRLRAWREGHGITQAELAKRIDRNSVWISRYFDAAYDADLDTLAKMADALGHTLYELFDIKTDAKEQALIDAYRALSPQNRSLAIQTLQAMIPAPRGARKSRDTR